MRLLLFVALRSRSRHTVPNAEHGEVPNLAGLPHEGINRLVEPSSGLSQPQCG